MTSHQGSAWQDIETAPKDGRVINAKRIYEGREMWRGTTCWRTVEFPAINEPTIDSMGDPHMFRVPAKTATGWMCADKEKRVPEPTHWKED